MKVLARGLNFMGQLGLENGYKNAAQFEQIPQLIGKNVTQLEAHFSQSYCKLDDGQILHWGYVLDSLTTTRVLSYYKRAPKLAQWWQRNSLFAGKTLGLRLGQEPAGLLNAEHIMKVTPKNISVGGSFLFFTTEDGRAYGMGENYKGQLGVNDLKFRFGFEQIQINQQNLKILQVATGFQHSILLTEQGTVFGCGRANWSQIVPTSYSGKKMNALIDFYQMPMYMEIPNEFIVKVAAGFHHSLFLCQSGNLYSLGFNNKGQCGTSNLNKVECDSFQQIFCNMQEDDEQIVDLACGKSHNILLSNKGNVYVFGSAAHFQLCRQPDFEIDLCSPTLVQLPLKEGEFPVKIKANFDRSAVITNLGNCFVWGGEDLSDLCHENYAQLENVKETLIKQQAINAKSNNSSSSNQYEFEFDEQSTYVDDIGLGFMHTLISVKNK